MTAVASSASFQSKSAQIRSRLNHPVIDSDGHILEFEAAVFEYLRDIAGDDLTERFRAESYRTNNYGNYCQNWESQFLTPEQRLDQRAPCSPWWGLPTKRTFDRAAASLPALLYKSLDEIGLDYTVLFPTFGLYTLGLDEPEFRRAGCRAVNMYNAEVLRGYSDRMAGVAVIPMHTPGEAIEELDYAVRVLKLKAVVLQSYVVRQVPRAAREHPEAARYSHWIDNFCVDSQYDYDPVWAKCAELGVSPTFHTPGYGFGTRATPSNWMHNHIGAFACGAESICRALFFGGVPKRFPTLRFGFLEGGVGWATALYADTIGHWKKRNREAIFDYDPSNLDIDLLRDLFRQYGGPVVTSKLDRVGKSEMNFAAFTAEKGVVDLKNIDEFADTGVSTLEDIRDIFSSFYFGCESDDPINASAFNTRMNPMGTRLNAILSSDIGHFDVPDITQVLEEAYELVERELITENDFRDFTFVNPARFWTAANPDFFKGTAVESAVAGLRK